MKVRWLAPVIFLPLVTFLMLGCAPTKAPEAKAPPGYDKITMVGFSIGNDGTTAVAVMTKILNQYYRGIEWASRSGSSGPNTIQLFDGVIKIGMSVATNYVDAWPNKAFEESRLRSLAIPLSVVNYIWFVPRDKPWTDLSQVPKGTSISMGLAGTSSPIGAGAWLKICGLSEKDFTNIHLGSDAMATAWREGKIDAGFNSISGLAPWVLDVTNSPRKPKVIGLTAEQLAKAKAERTFEKLGFLTPEMTNLAELTGGLLTDVNAPKSTQHVACRDDFPEEIAYNMAKVLDEHRQEAIDTFSAFKYGTPQQHIKYAVPPLALHPGVARYYKEKGYLK